MGDLPRTLLVVAPRNAAPALRKRGFKSTDRGNNFTETLYKLCPSPEAAQAESRALGSVGLICGIVASVA